MERIKATFYLPLQDNDGQDLSAAIKQAEWRCFAVFGGGTMMGYFKDAWRMKTGVCQIDDSMAYSVVLEEAQLPELKAILREFKAQSKQETLYVEIDRHTEVEFL